MDTHCFLEGGNNSLCSPLSFQKKNNAGKHNKKKHRFLIVLKVYILYFLLNHNGLVSVGVTSSLRSY